MFLYFASDFELSCKFYLGLPFKKSNLSIDELLMHLQANVSSKEVSFGERTNTFKKHKTA